MTKKEILIGLTSLNVKTYWEMGVKNYAEMLVEGLYNSKEYTVDNISVDLLNGADDWSEFSYNGNALIYDRAIAETLCTPSELKKKRV